MELIEVARCTAGTDVTVVVVVMLDVVAILDEVLPGVEDAGGVGTDA